MLRGASSPSIALEAPVPSIFLTVILQSCRSLSGFPGEQKTRR